MIHKNINNDNDTHTHENQYDKSFNYIKSYSDFKVRD
jgi:hypothetical protein